MTTINVILEDNSMVSSLRSILSRLNGVKTVTVLEEVDMPNKKTLAAMKELERGKGKVFASVDALFDDLDD
jgi:hypothetical protein